MTNLTILLFAVSVAVQAQDVIGKWKTIDDETGEERSIVDIFQKNGKVYGKVVKLIRVPGEDPDPVCTECDNSDDRFNKKIIGMEILRDMERSGDEYSGGHILDPKNGRVYRCSIWVEGNELKVRGYWGPFYRTQTWLKSQ